MEGDCIKDRLSKNLVWRSYMLLEETDRRKSIVIFFSYALMGVLDVVSVFTIGIMLNGCLVYFILKIRPYRSKLRSLGWVPR